MRKKVVRNRFTLLPGEMTTATLGYSTENSPSKRTSLRWGDDCAV